MSPAQSTFEDVGETAGRVRRARRVRRVFLVALVVFVALGLVDFWGVRYSTATASDPEQALEVRYPRVVRPGLGASIEIVVTRHAGFDGPVSLSLDSDYLDLFDEHGTSPQPAEETQTAERTIWEFEPPHDSTSFMASFDLRVAPSRWWGRGGDVQLLGPDGETHLEVDFHTWIAP